MHIWAGKKIHRSECNKIQSTSSFWSEGGGCGQDGAYGGAAGVPEKVLFLELGSAYKGVCLITIC